MMTAEDRRRSEDDLLANMTPISGLQNLSESIVVNGVRYHANEYQSQRSQRKLSSKNRGHNHSSRHASLQQRRSVSESPGSHHRRGRKKFNKNLGNKKHHQRSKSMLMPTSPVNRSQPIPIPESPTLKGMKRVNSRDNFRDKERYSRDFDMFQLGLRRSHTEPECKTLGNNSFRDHGFGFEFVMESL